MGAHPECSLKVLGVHNQAGKLVGEALQPEEHPQPHIVNTAPHGPIHSLSMPVVVGLGAGRVQLTVTLLVVSLLKQDVRPDARLLEQAILRLRGGGDVHINPPDLPVAMPYGIDGLHRLKDVLDGVVPGILPRFNGQPLVAHVLQGHHLRANLLLSQLAPRNLAVLGVIGAIQAAVDTVIGQVERGKQHNPVSVIGLLNLPGQSLDLIIDLGVVTGKEHGGLSVADGGAMVCRNALSSSRPASDSRALPASRAGCRRVQVAPGLIQDSSAQVKVILMGLGKIQGIQNLLMVYELVRAGRCGIIHVGHVMLSLTEVSNVLPYQLGGRQARRLLTRPSPAYQPGGSPLSTTR